MLRLIAIALLGAGQVAAGEPERPHDAAGTAAPRRAQPRRQARPPPRGAIGRLAAPDPAPPPPLVLHAPSIPHVEEARAPAPRPVERRRGASATRAGFVLELRSEFGFEPMLELELANDRRVALNLNDGLGVSAGVSFLPLARGRLATRASAGFKLGRLRASNGKALFTAFPVDLMEAAYLGPLRLGVGVSVLLAPRVRGEGILEHASRAFDPAPGAIADVEWLVSSRTRTGIGLRASWYRFASKSTPASPSSREDVPSLGLIVRSDLALSRR